MKQSLQIIKNQLGSCEGLFCPECDLLEKCHINPEPQHAEDVLQQRLNWIKELENDRP